MHRCGVWCSQGILEITYSGSFISELSRGPCDAQGVDVRSAISPIQTPSDQPVVLSHRGCGQMMTLVSVSGLPFGLPSLWMDSDLGVDVRQGSSVGLGLTCGSDIHVPVVAR